MTKIISCKCEHLYQDKRYGVGNRVHNKGKAKMASKELYRCTVCNSVKEL